MDHRPITYAITWGSSRELWKFLAALIALTVAAGGFCYFMDEVLGIG